MSGVRVFFAVVILTAAAGCAIQRAQTAAEARSKMLGFTKEQVLACMGPPANRAAAGATEVWSYNSGNGYTQISTLGHSTTNASMYGDSNYAFGNASTFGTGFGVASRRFCKVNIVMGDGRVTSVNYSGPTGGLLTRGEQCAFAVENCVH